jgi:hypothetical protein
VDRQNLSIFIAVLLISDGDLIFDESSRNTEFSVHKDKILLAAKSSFALLHLNSVCYPLAHLDGFRLIMQF